MSKRSDTLLVLFLVALLGAIYMRFTDMRYFVDGLNTAWLMETSGTWIVHPNHPLFPLMPQMVFVLLGGESEAIDALGFLLVWTTAFGMISCLGVWLLAREAGGSIGNSIFVLLLFAFSSGVWYFNATPNQYSTALAAYIFTFLAIVRTGRAGRAGSSISVRHSVLLGIFIGIATLIHQVNALLVIPLAWTIYRTNNTSRGRMISLITAFIAALVVAVGFTILCGILIVGIHSMPEFIEWQKSYVTQTQYWAHGLIDAVQRTARGALDLQVAHTFHSEGLFSDWHRRLSAGILLFRAAQAFVILFIVIETVRGLVEYFRDRSKPYIRTVALYAALPYVIFTLFFTPESINYRIFYLPGWLIFMTPVFERHFRFQKPQFRSLWLPALVIMVLFTANFTIKFYPDSIPDNNPYIYEAGLMSTYVGSGDLVIYSGAEVDYLRAQYIRYASHADILILPKLIESIRSDPERVIEDFEERAERGNLIVVHEDALFSDEDVEWLNNFYRMDIRPRELADFIREHTRIATSMVVNGKEYILIVPDQDQDRDQNPERQPGID
jgi:hypothetical protein